MCNKCECNKEHEKQLLHLQSECLKFYTDESKKLIFFCKERDLTGGNGKTIQDYFFEYVLRLEKEISEDKKYMEVVLKKLERAQEILDNEYPYKVDLEEE